MNKALKPHRNKRWKDTRFYRKIQARLSIGHALTFSSCVSGGAVLSAIRSTVSKSPEAKERKAEAIATAIINNAIAMNKALNWGR